MAGKKSKVTENKHSICIGVTAPIGVDINHIENCLDEEIGKLRLDVTFTVENTRPINADVLVKAATPIAVDVTLNVVVTTAFINNTETVQQNVQDAVTTELNAQALGTIVDSSDLVSAAYTVEGVDRVRVLFFNKSNEAGSVLSIVAEKNEFIVANNITINIESR